MTEENDSIGKLLRTNKRLMRDLSRIETVFNAINSAIIVTNNQGEVKFANDFAERILGLSKNPPSLFKIIPDLEEAIAKVSAQDAAVRMEFSVDYPECRVLDSQIIPFDFGEAGGTYALILNDVTSRRRSDMERIESEKIASVLNLAAGVAHELGNPLNSINIHLQLVSRRLAKVTPQPENAEVFDAVRESVKICSDEVKRLDSIIENFLKALRPMRPDLKECDLLKPLAETLKLLDGELSNLNISVEVKTSGQLPMVLADENLIKQLYFNLLKNAMEAISGKGRITITATSSDKDVTISVADTGCGIDSDGISRLFQPYYTTKPDGHGLGMTIIQSIVRAHFGKISVDSKKGEGTTISVKFPRARPVVKMIQPA